MLEFESMMSQLAPMAFGGHRYVLAATGTPMSPMTFGSRQCAEQAMYGIIGRRGLHIGEVYDDRHDKTYVCEGGVRFYITRW